MPYFLGDTREDNVFIVVIHVEMNIQRGKKMKYNCRYCEWSFEGNNSSVKDILAHDRTHPENKINDCVYKGTEVVEKPKCSWCGCNVDHE